MLLELITYDIPQKNCNRVKRESNCTVLDNITTNTFSEIIRSYMQQ